MTNFTVHKIVEACQKPGCPLCRIEQQSVERYLENQLYENVNSPRWRDRLRQSLGFCHEHAWLAVNERLGDALGFSIIYQDLLNTLLKSLSEEAPTSTSSQRIGLNRKSDQDAQQKIENLLAALTPPKPCPVCQEREEVARTTIAVLVTELKTDSLKEALGSSDGLCLPHLRLTLQQIRNVPEYETLLTIQRDKLSSLVAELAEFIRKNDYQNVGEGFGKEGDAWLRGIAALVGRRRER